MLYFSNHLSYQTWRNVILPRIPEDGKLWRCCSPRQVFSTPERGLGHTAFRVILSDSKPSQILTSATVLAYKNVEFQPALIKSITSGDLLVVVVMFA